MWIWCLISHINIQSTCNKSFYVYTGVVFESTESSTRASGHPSTVFNDGERCCGMKDILKCYKLPRSEKNYIYGPILSLNAQRLNLSVMCLCFEQRWQSAGLGWFSSKSTIFLSTNLKLLPVSWRMAIKFWYCWLNSDMAFLRFTKYFKTNKFSLHCSASFAGYLYSYEILSKQKYPHSKDT